MKDIRKEVIAKLIVGGMIISIIMGFISYKIEMKELENTVINLVKNELNDNKIYLNNFQPADLELIKEKAANDLKNNFVRIELYAADKALLMETVNQSIQVNNETLKRFKGLTLTNSETYAMYYSNNAYYLQMIIPIESKNGSVGYFKGLYQVNKANAQKIKHEISWAVSQTVIVVFIVALLLHPIIMNLNKNVFSYSAKLLDANIDLLKVLGSTVEKRDSETNIHNYRVTVYSVRLAEYIGLPSKQISFLIIGALLHDVGKIAISDKILLKPGKLNKEEFEEMKSHVKHGIDIIKNSEWLNQAKEVVLYHHEKYDGSGYMKGLKGEEIPINARIFAIVDVFDALTQRRPYKEPFSFDKSMEILLANSGTHFDPKILDSFSKIAKKIYNEVSNESNEKIEKMLKEIVEIYFKF